MSRRGMHNLRRNETSFEYLPPDGETSDLNENGEHTGEYHRQYGTPVRYRGNISAPNGQTNQTFYGMDIRYTHTLVMEDPNVEIKEDGLIRWKDDLYEIRAKRPSLNSISFALRKITTETDDPYVPENTDGDS